MYQSINNILFGQDTSDTLLARLHGSADKLAKGATPAILTHFERAEYFLAAIQSAHYRDACTQWTRRFGRLYRLRRTFEAHFSASLSETIDAYAADARRTPDLSAFKIPLAPCCGVLPNEFWLVIEDKLAVQNATEAEIEVDAGVYRVILHDVEFSYSSIPSAYSRVSLLPVAGDHQPYLLTQSVLLEACRAGKAIVPAIACAGVPTHYYVDAGGLPEALQRLAPQMSGHLLSEPSATFLDRLDERFVSRFGAPRPEHLLWLSWMYHPRAGLVPDFSRNTCIRLLLPLAA